MSGQSVRKTVSGAKRRRQQRQQQQRRQQAVEALEERRLLAAPVIDPVVLDVTQIPVGRSLMIPLTSSDPEGETVTWSVSDNKAAIRGRILSKSNPFLELNVAGFGKMVFELTRDLAPRAVDNIRGLVYAGFYNGLTFHRIMDNFMIQGGDPLGTGTGGPEEAAGDPGNWFEWDDEYHKDALFTGYGQLAMAKAGDDTNGSQFFITDSSPRHLDFNHTIFGQLVRGREVLQALASVPVGADGQTPINKPVITSARIVKNRTDAVLLLTADEALGGTATVTVTATDSSGQSSSRTFEIGTRADTSNAPPSFLPLPNFATSVNTPVSFDVTPFDVEGDDVTVDFGAVAPSTAGTVSVSGNRVTFTPAQGFTGPATFLVRVRDATHGFEEIESVTVVVGDRNIALTAHGVGLVPFQTTTIEVGRFKVAGSSSTATGGYTAEVVWGDGTRSAGSIANLGPGEFQVLASHAFANPGYYPMRVRVTSAAGLTVEAIGSVTVEYAMLQKDPFNRSRTALVVGGTNGSDTIGFQRAGTVIRPQLNGSSLGSFEPTGRVMVFAGGGDDRIELTRSLGRGVEFHGQGGNDTLIGGGSNDILLGHAGDDVLMSSSGRDLLIGGAGTDVLVAAEQDDILIAAGTRYDAESVFLTRILKEWQRTDRTYADRMRALRGQIAGINGNTILNASRVTEDNAMDSMAGDSGRDAFFANLVGGTLDIIDDREGNETLVEL